MADHTGTTKKKTDRHHVGDDGAHGVTRPTPLAILDELTRLKVSRLCFKTGIEHELHLFRICLQSQLGQWKIYRRSMMDATQYIRVSPFFKFWEGDGLWDKREGATPLGLIGWQICFPRVVPRRTRDNRWALGRNPFGIGISG